MVRLKSMDLEALKEYLAGLGLPPYRGEQIFRWMHRGVSSFEEMSDLPLSLREKLKGQCTLEVLQTETVQISRRDGTRKYLFSLEDGQKIESVLMRYRYGNTACISSQAGCRMGCAFCASKEGGLIRQLTEGEMLEQVLRMKRESGLEIQHVVVMGTGEPFDNYRNLVGFLRLLHNPLGLGMSYRSMTVSTCGLIPGIDAFAGDMPQTTLAVSLHAPQETLRSRLMPINRKYPLKELMEACRRYTQRTNKRITFEYVLIEGVNDSGRMAESLALLLKGMLCHVNLIPFNGIYRNAFRSASPEVCRRFLRILSDNGIQATLRRELGRDIDGACGQLRSRKSMSLETGEGPKEGDKIK